MGRSWGVNEYCKFNCTKSIDHIWYYMIYQWWKPIMKNLWNPIMKKNLSNSSYSSETPIIPWISTHFPTIFPHLPLPFGNRVARSPDFAHAQWSASAAVNPAVFVGGFYWGQGNVYHGYFYFNWKIWENPGMPWEKYSDLDGFRFPILMAYKPSIMVIWSVYIMGIS